MKITVTASIPNDILTQALTADDLDAALIPFQTLIGVDGGTASQFFGDVDEELWRDPATKKDFRRCQRFLAYVELELTLILSEVLS